MTPHGNPLAEYAKKATSPIMRELASLTMARGHTQQWIARALGTKAANVARYFTAMRPQQYTVDRMAGLLGMDQQHARLVQRDPLQAEELLEAEHDLLDEVKRNRAFSADAAATIQGYLRRAPEQVRASAVAAYLLAGHRAMCGLTPSVQSSYGSSALRAFAAALGHRFDLLSLLRDHEGPHDTLLLDMYLLLTSDHDLNHSQAEDILAVLRPTLRLANFAVDRMDEPLHSSREYHGGVSQMKTLSNTIKKPNLKKASKDEQS